MFDGGQLGHGRRKYSQRRRQVASILARRRHSRAQAVRGRFCGVDDSGRFSLARDINNADQIVGFSDGAGIRAILWEAGEMIDLNDRIDPSSPGWVLLDAFGINDAGQIAGYGTHHGQPARVSRRAGA